MKIPAEVEVSRVEPKYGWKYDLIRNDAKKVVGIVWSAAEGGLTATEFGEFNMSGKVGDNTTQIVWKANQTYKDGTVVEWTGSPDSKTPASVTIVKPKTVCQGFCVTSQNQN